MSSAGMQAVTDIVTLLSSNWNSANTDNSTPKFTDNLSTPWEDLDFGLVDHLYVKYDTETITTGMYALDFYHAVAITIEVMTKRVSTPQGGRSHFQKLMEEAARIIKASARQAGYAQTVVRSTKARYVKERGIFVGALEVDLRKVTTS